MWLQEWWLFVPATALPYSSCEEPPSANACQRPGQQGTSGGDGSTAAAPRTEACDPGLDHPFSWPSAWVMGKHEAQASASCPIRLISEPLPGLWERRHSLFRYIAFRAVNARQQPLKEILTKNVANRRIRSRDMERKPVPMTSLSLWIKTHLKLDWWLPTQSKTFFSFS